METLNQRGISYDVYHDMFEPAEQNFLLHEVSKNQFPEVRDLVKKWYHKVDKAWYLKSNTYAYDGLLEKYKEYLTILFNDWQKFLASRHQNDTQI